MSMLYTAGRFKYLTDAGTNASGYRLYTFASGTTTFLTTYTDSTLTTPSTYTTDGSGLKYITLNSRGEAQVWLGSSAYTFVVADASGVTKETTNGVKSIATDLSDAIAAIEADLSASTGADMVGYGTGTVGDELDMDVVLRSGRTSPNSAFDWFSADFSVAECSGPGRALLNQDIADVFYTKFSALWGGAVSYVRPTGNDSNDGATWASAFLTLGKALRNTTNGTIYIWPGTYDLSDFRYSDSYGDKPKRIIAPFGGVTLKVSGDTISSATWTANGTYGSVYQTTLSTSNQPVRILHTGLVDRFGEYVPIPKYASLADVNTSTCGWYYDSGTKILYVRMASENVNTTTKANLVAVYGDTTATNRTLIYSATSYWENITFWGYVSVLKLAGQAVPQFWAKNCTFKYGASSALLVEGGYCYTQDCRAHRCAGDGANYNTTAGTVSQGIEVNYKTEFCGDVGTYGTTQALNPLSTAENKNGSSNHDSYVVRINGQHEENWGPAVADTSGSYSWCLGTKVGHSALTAGTSPAVPRYGFLNQGNNAWLDNCSATGHDKGFNSDSSANVRVFACRGSTLATLSGTFTNYTPTP